MTDTKKCTMCLIEKPKNLKYFYKGKIELRAKCKKCCCIEVVNNPNKHTLNKNYYEKNKEHCIKLVRLNQFEKKTGIGLVC